MFTQPTPPFIKNPVQTLIHNHINTFSNSFYYLVDPKIKTIFLNSSVHVYEYSFLNSKILQEIRGTIRVYNKIKNKFFYKLCNSDGFITIY